MSRRPENADIMQADQIFNLCEGILWIGIALSLLCVSLKVDSRKEQSKHLPRVAAVAFFLFGISDFIEISTRAWYEPLPLLLLKAACVSTLLTCLVIYRRRRPKSRN